MLIIGTWRWGDKYGPEYVERLRRGFAKHLKCEHRFEVFTPNWQDEHLARMPGCFPRLRMFDPDWQKAHDIKDGDRIVCADLDAIVVGDCLPLFHRPEPFMILRGANAVNPCPYNGSLWMLRAGFHKEVWSEFTLEQAAKVPFYLFPDDQSWFEYKIPKADGWNVGAQSGVYAFQKPGWPKGNDLPKDARFVCFPGHRDPSQFKHLDWVKKHWVDA